MEDKDLFENSEVMLDMVVDRMLRSLTLVEKFIFTYTCLLGRTDDDVSFVLNMHKTNISRRIKQIRKKLSWYKLGYVNKTDKISDNKLYGTNKLA